MWLSLLKSLDMIFLIMWLDLVYIQSNLVKHVTLSTGYQNFSEEKK